MVMRHNKPITILVVDDDSDCRMLIRDAVAECRVAHRIVELGSGDAALQYLAGVGQASQPVRPSLIFLDIEMPGINGLETLRRIRRQREWQDIPVVMMTGVCGEREMKQAADYGANSYILKPANAEEFLRTVLASTSYWLTVHQYPEHHMPAEACRR